MLRLTCPYCNHEFDLLPNSTGTRIPCPRCSEGVNVEKAVEMGNVEAVSLPSGDGDKPNRKWLLAVVLFSLALGVVALILYDRNWGVDPPSTKPLPPGTTKPPMLLAGLRRMPSDVQLLVAIQPSVMADYAQRKGQSFEDLLKSVGLPASVMAQIRKFGLEPEQIDHLAFGVNLNGVPPSMVFVLVLRQEMSLAIESKPIADKPGHSLVDLGLPLTFEMKKIDGTTYMFATDGKKLDAPAMPNADHLSTGLKESMGKLSPASFAWLASDSQDWGKNKLLELGAALAKQPDLPKRLENVRAFALGLSLEPEMRLTLAVRSPDSNASEAMAKNWKERFAEAKPEVSNDGTWATGRIPFDPPQEVLDVLKKGLGP